MPKCETQIDNLRADLEADIWTFRWIWLINVAAIVWGGVMRHPDVVVISLMVGVVALVGVGRTRRDRRLLDRVVSVCFGIREEVSREEPQ